MYITKKEWMEGTPKLASGMPYYYWYRARAIAMGWHPFPISNWYAFPKHEILRLLKALSKTRLITASSIELSLLGEEACGLLNEMITRKSVLLKTTIGFDPSRNGWNTVVRWLLGYKKDTKIDYSDVSRWDGSLSPALLDLVYKFREIVTQPSYEQRQLLQYYHSELVYSNVFLSTGGDAYILGGNKSGSVNTTYDNTIAHWIAIAYCFAELGLGYSDFANHRFLVCGDDLIAEQFPAGFWDCYKSLGFIVDIKTSMIESAEYLSMRTKLTPYGYMPYPASDKCLYSLATTDDKNWPETLKQKLTALAFLNFWHPNFNIFEEACVLYGVNIPRQSYLDYWRGVLIQEVGGKIKNNTFKKHRRSIRNCKSCGKKQSNKQCFKCYIMNRKQGIMTLPARLPQRQRGFRKKPPSVPVTVAVPQTAQLNYNVPSKNALKNRQRRERRKQQMATLLSNSGLGLVGESSSNKLMQSVRPNAKVKLSVSSRKFIETKINPCGDGNIAHGDARTPDGSTTKSVPSQQVYTFQVSNPTSDANDTFCVYIYQLPFLQHLGFMVAINTKIKVLLSEPDTWNKLLDTLSAAASIQNDWLSFELDGSNKCWVKWLVASGQSGVPYNQDLSDTIVSWHLTSRSGTVEPTPSNLINEGSLIGSSFPPDFSDTNIQFETYTPIYTTRMKKSLMKANKLVEPATNATVACTQLILPLPVANDLVSADPKSKTLPFKEGAYSITRQVAKVNNWIDASEARPMVMLAQGAATPFQVQHTSENFLTDLFDPSYSINILLIEAIDANSSFLYTVHTYSEFQASPHSTIAQFTSASPKADEQALVVCHDLSQKLDSMYPSSYNKKGILGELATSLLGGVPVVGPIVDILGNLLGI